MAYCYAVALKRLLDSFVFVVEDDNQSDGRTEEVTADDDLSDLSDEDEYLYPDEEGEKMKLMRLKLEGTTSFKIKKLFSNTDKVIIHMAQISFTC